MSGIVVTLIGLSLIKVGITACGGGEAAKEAGTFGAFEHVGLAALALVLIILFIRSSIHYLRMSSIVIGLRLCGCLDNGNSGLFCLAGFWNIQYSCTF